MFNFEVMLKSISGLSIKDVRSPGGSGFAKQFENFADKGVLQMWTSALFLCKKFWIF